MTKFQEITSLSITSIEAPRQSDLLIELIKKLKPQVVVAGIAIFLRLLLVQILYSTRCWISSFLGHIRPLGAIQPSRIKWELCFFCYILKTATVTVPADAGAGFKFTEKTLTEVLRTVKKKPWVCLSGPTINTTGLVYSNKEIWIRNNIWTILLNGWNFLHQTHHCVCNNLYLFFATEEVDVLCFWTNKSMLTTQKPDILCKRSQQESPRIQYLKAMLISSEHVRNPRNDWICKQE